MSADIEQGLTRWPRSYEDRYVAEGIWMGVSLYSAFQDQAMARSTKLAVVDGPERLTYNELVERSASCAAHLGQLGLRRGDRILVQLPNTWEFVVLTLACLRTGVVPVMALPAHRRSELSYLVDHAEVRGIAVPTQFRGFDHQTLARELRDENQSLNFVFTVGPDAKGDSIDLSNLCRQSPQDTTATAESNQIRPEPSGSDIAVFLLSGGTTGLPKLIARTNNDYTYNAVASARVSGFDIETVYLVTLPASHNFPLACPGILGTLLTGGTVILLPSPAAPEALATIEREGVTHSAVVPAVCGTWLDHHERAQAAGDAADVGSLRVLQVGGSRLAQAQAERVEPVLGARLQQVFGMAEGLLNYTDLSDSSETICQTQGRPLSSFDEIRIVDASDEDVEPGELGSLLTRGPYTPRGYYKAEGHNAKAFTNDGWFRTGDICRLRADGSLVVEGRDKDMINRGGEKVSAEEVENLVYQHEGVTQAAAVAMPDPVLGERVCVYIVLDDGFDLTLEQIREAMGRTGVAKFKWPERLVLTTDLPKTKVGKVDKRALRDDPRSQPDL